MLLLTRTTPVTTIACASLPFTHAQIYSTLLDFVLAATIVNTSLVLRLKPSYDYKWSCSNILTWFFVLCYLIIDYQT